ncbi:THO complex subunit 2 [Podila epicladia]|nr:THO complex subunit 2 [Podila epicladia]
MPSSEVPQPLSLTPVPMLSGTKAQVANPSGAENGLLANQLPGEVLAPNLLSPAADRPASDDMHITESSMFTADTMVMFVVAMLECLSSDPIEELNVVITFLIANVWTHHTFFVKLLQKWKSSNIQLSCEKECTIVLSKKFQEMEEPGNEKVDAFSIHSATALLLKERLIDVADIFPEASRTDKDCQSRARQSETMMPTKDGNTCEGMNITMIESDDVPRVPMLLTRVHQVGVLNAILTIGDIDTIKAIIARLPTIATSHPEVADRVCSTVQGMIQGIYDSTSPDAHPTMMVDPTPMCAPHQGLKSKTSIETLSPRSVDEFDKNVQPLVAFIGVQIHRSPILFSMLCQTGSAALDCFKGSIAETESSLDSLDGKYQKMKSLKSKHAKIESIWLEMAKTSLLPALYLFQVNKAPIDDLWHLLKRMGRKSRASLYSNCKTDSVLQLLLSVDNTENRVMDLLGGIQEREERSRGFAELAHSNPVIVFDVVLKQIGDGNRTMVQSLTDVCKHLTDFSADVLAFALVEAFSKVLEGEVQNKAQDVHTSPPVQRLLRFYGHLYRACPRSEFDLVLQLVIEKIRPESKDDWKVLQEIFIGMGGMRGVADMNQLNMTKIVCLAGGRTLRKAVYGGATSTVTMRTKFRERLFAHRAMSAQLLERVGQCPQGLAATAHSTLLMYFGFLCRDFGKEYQSLCPSVTDLCEKYQVCPSSAMSVVRPILKAISHQEERQMGLASLEFKADPETVANKLQEMEGEIWMNSLASVTRDISAMLPAQAWSGMIPQFFVTFNQLTLYDISVPNEQYQVVLKKLKKRDPSDSSIGRLVKEQEQQVINRRIVMDRIAREKNHWFKELSTPVRVEQIVRHCIIPRAKACAVDAMYCAKFIDILHGLNTRNFSRLNVYQRLLAAVKRVICESTEQEVRAFGVLMREVLSHLSRWYKFSVVYEQEGCSRQAIDLPSYTRRGANAGKNEDQLSHVIFRDVVNEWHVNLHKVIDEALQSKNKSRIENALAFLRQVSTYFPATLKDEEQLVKRMHDLCRDKVGNNLNDPINAYLANIKNKSTSSTTTTAGEIEYAFATKHNDAITATATAAITTAATTAAAGEIKHTATTKHNNITTSATATSTNNVTQTIDQAHGDEGGGQQDNRNKNEDDQSRSFRGADTTGHLKRARERIGQDEVVGNTREEKRIRLSIVFKNSDQEAASDPVLRNNGFTAPVGRELGDGRGSIDTGVSGVSGVLGKPGDPTVTLTTKTETSSTLNTSTDSSSGPREQDQDTPKNSITNSLQGNQDSRWQNGGRSSGRRERFGGVQDNHLCPSTFGIVGSQGQKRSGDSLEQSADGHNQKKFKRTLVDTTEQVAGNTSERSSGTWTKINAGVSTTSSKAAGSGHILQDNNHASTSCPDRGSAVSLKSYPSFQDSEKENVRALRKRRRDGANQDGPTNNGLQPKRSKTTDSAPSYNIRSRP